MLKHGLAKAAAELTLWNVLFWASLASWAGFIWAVRQLF